MIESPWESLFALKMKKNPNPGKVISELCFQLSLWVTKRVETFPRSHKFTIGDRLQTLSIDVLMMVVEATYTKDRGGLLKSLQIQLEKFRFLTRIAAETQLLTLKQYEFASKQINEIGRSVGGWSKAHYAQTA